MQITKQADYAVRAVQYLSELEEGVLASTSRIAADRKIPSSFLAKIIAQLSVAGILQTSRGARGGVRLAKEPQEISLLEVIEAIDGPLALNSCVHQHPNCELEDCAVRPVWAEIQEGLVSKLKASTFDQFKKK